MDCDSDSGSGSGSAGGAARSVEFVTFIDLIVSIQATSFQTTFSLDKNLDSSDQNNSGIFIKKTLPSTVFCPSDPAPSKG